jgi:hypothetical protein
MKVPRRWDGTLDVVSALAEKWLVLDLHGRHPYDLDIAALVRGCNPGDCQGAR